MVDKAALRQRVTERYKHLTAARQTYEVGHIMSLLEDLLELAKLDLVTCNPQDFIGKQAEARVYDKMLNTIRLGSHNLNIPAGA